MNNSTGPADLEIVVFEVAERRFGVRAENVREVLQAVTLVPAPRPQFAVKGIVNLRGQVVTVLDIRALVGLPDKPIEHTDHLIVVQVDGRSVAICVDRAVELAHLSADCLGPAQDAAGNWDAVAGVTQVAGGLAFVLDPRKLLAPLDPPAEPKPPSNTAGAETRP